MTNLPDTSPTRQPRKLRWFALALALLLHAAAFLWAEGAIGPLSWHNKRDQPHEVIAAELKAPPAPTQPPTLAKRETPPVVPPTPRKPRPRTSTAHPPTPAVQQPPAESAAVADAEPAVTGAADAPADNPAPPQAVAKAATPDAAPPQPAAEEAGGKRYKVAPPPPAELKYDVYALREGQKWHGAGAFRWESSGRNYSVTGEASITFIFKIAVLNFRSEGEIADFGIAPVLYSEKPFRKSLTNTHFQHANGKISFSASEASYPYKGGEQDRGSIIWQLAGIGRADASQLAPGTDIDVVVAGVRDADTWRIKVVGGEDIDTGLGKVNAWHVSRAPRPGSYDQAIDIWFAPQREWYPVKVRYTYANGDFLELSASSLTPLAAQ